MRIIILIALFLSLSMVGYSSEPEQSSDSIVELTKEAEKGYADAQYHLGNCYFTGAGVEKDPEKAVSWFTKAAVEGIVDAQLMVGDYTADGGGVEQDDENVVFGLIEAAEQGKLRLNILLGSAIITEME